MAKSKAFGSVKGPGGEDMNPLAGLADVKDLEKIGQGISDVTWGSAQVFKGMADAKYHKNSIIGMAQANVFEFPVFISESVPLDYATATNTLLEQMYAAYLQMAISIDPVVDYKQVRSRKKTSQFSKFKTNTTKYIECVDLSFQKQACHNEIFNEEYNTTVEFNMVSIEDSDANIINEALEYQPLSEFDHYFQEGMGPTQTRMNARAEALRNFNIEITRNAAGTLIATIPQLSGGRVRFDSNNRIITRPVPVDAAHQNTIVAASRALINARADYEMRESFQITNPFTGRSETVTRAQLANSQAQNAYIRSFYQIWGDRNNAEKGREELEASQTDILRILARPSSSWNNSEIQKVSNYYQALSNRSETQANSDRITNIIDRLNNGRHLTGSEERRLREYFQTRMEQEKFNASSKSIAAILGKQSNDWSNSEIEKVTNYFKSEKEIRERHANVEHVRDIVTKLDRGENITGEEQKRLRDFFDMVTSRGKAEEAEESREKHVVRARGEVRILANGLVSAGPAVLKKLTAKGIDIEKSKADLEQITKALQDVDEAERWVMNWLNTDDSDSGGLTPTQKKNRFGSSLRELRGRDILHDSNIKQSNAELLQKRVDSYNNFIKKYGVTPDEFDYDSNVKREAREERKERFEHNATKAPQFIDENKLKKLNTMKPLMMTVSMNIMADDGHVSHPMEYVVGVKTHCRIIKSDILPEVVQYPLKEMNKVARSAKYRAGELRFFHDILFHIKEKKQTSIDSRDPNRKWYRRLYELAHMKGDGNVSRAIAGNGSVDGLIPNATIIISKSDADHIEEVTKIDMLDASKARRFCEELFLSCFIVIDIDNESIKILTPDINNDFEVQSLAAVNKQIAELDTAGKSTRDIFKMLK